MHVLLGDPSKKQILSITTISEKTTIYELGKLELDSDFLFFFFFLFWESSEYRIPVASSGAGTELMNVRIWCDIGDTPGRPASWFHNDLIMMMMIMLGWLIVDWLRPELMMMMMDGDGNEDGKS